MRVLLLGATGLTGSLVLQKLLQCPAVSEVSALTRRPLGVEHPKLRTVEVSFDRMTSVESAFKVDVVISCLGTTIKKAGSRRQFRKVDYDYVMQAARLAKKQGVEAFLLMSAMGASSSSWVFYNRVKGQLEDSLEALEFPRLSIYQPGLLLSERQESRLLESFGIAAMTLANPLLMGRFRTLRGIEPATIATAMVKEIATMADNDSIGEPMTTRRQYDDICELAGYLQKT